MMDIHSLQWRRVRFFGAAVAGLVLAALPAAPLSIAFAQAPQTRQLLSPADAQILEQFYASRRDAPLWLSAGTATPPAMQLMTILKRAQLDGFEAGPQLAAEAEAAMDAAAGGSSAAIGQADRLLSSIWIGYVRALRAPVPGFIYGDAFVTPRVPSVARVIRQAADAASLEQHVNAVSTVNPFYAQLREAAWNQVQAAGGTVDPRLLANLARLRMLPAKGRFIMVDVAAAQLLMVENGQIQDSMKVIVGKPVSQTPLVASTIHYATFNPYWHVPPDMVRRNIAANAQRMGASYFRDRGYEVVSGYTDDATVLPLDQIDWKSVGAGQTQAWVRQLPGSRNEMGRIKFQFPNEAGIYLHDTPHKELFAKTQRTLSGGCIRLEDAPRLGRWLLGREPIAPSSEPEAHVPLPAGVPVYVTYLTTRVEGAQLTLASDVYGLDKTSGTQFAVPPTQTATPSAQTASPDLPDAIPAGQTGSPEARAASLEVAP